MDLINQLYDIATNEEFTREQRLGLMKIVMDDAAKPAPAASLDIATICHGNPFNRITNLRMGETPNG